MIRLKKNFSLYIPLTQYLWWIRCLDAYPGCELAHRLRKVAGQFLPRMSLKPPGQRRDCSHPNNTKSQNKLHILSMSHTAKRLAHLDPSAKYIVNKTGWHPCYLDLVIHKRSPIIAEFNGSPHAWKVCSDQGAEIKEGLIIETVGEDAKYDLGEEHQPLRRSLLSERSWWYSKLPKDMRHLECLRNYIYLLLRLTWGRGLILAWKTHVKLHIFKHQ